MPVDSRGAGTYHCGYAPINAKAGRRVYEVGWTNLLAPVFHFAGNNPLCRRG